MRCQCTPLPLTCCTPSGGANCVLGMYHCRTGIKGGKSKVKRKQITSRTWLERDSAVASFFSGQLPMIPSEPLVTSAIASASEVFESVICQYITSNNGWCVCECVHVFFSFMRKFHCWLLQGCGQHYSITSMNGRCMPEMPKWLRW